jgi:lysophospholipase L1-like esterase
MRHPWRNAVICFFVGLIASFGISYGVLKANGSINYGTYGSGPAAAPVSSPIRSTPDYITRSAWMIAGDSITVRDYKDVAATNPGARLAVNAWSGRNTQLTVDEILNKSLTPMIPKYLIMAVGSNDVMSPFGMPAQIKRLLDYVNTNFPETQIFWVDVQVNRPAYSPSDQRNSMIVNKAIYQGCTEQYHCTVISWASFLAAKPSRFAMYLDSGGVHPNPAGTKALASLIDAAVPVS